LKYQTENNLTKTTPKKFYYLWQYVEWGGAQILLLGLMKEAKKFGEVQAVIPRGSNEQLLKFLGNLNITTKFFDGQTDIKPAYTLKRKLQRHWNKLYFEFNLISYLSKLDFRNSVIHTEFAPWQSMLMLLWLCRKAQVFVTMHNSLPGNSIMRNAIWKIKFRILGRSKNFHLFTANKDTKNSLKPLVSQDFLNKVKVTYASINPWEIKEALRSELNRAEILRKYNLPENKFLVFCVGQFIDRKGRWIFLEAARQLSKNNNEFAFVWISNSKPSYEDLEKAESYNLGRNFVFITSDQVGTEHIDLFNLLRQADVFALASYLEGLPISILEAMALGIPTVSTNINSIPEAVKHLETGLLIEPGDTCGLKDAILLLKSDHSLREKLSIEGKKYVLKNFDETVVAKIVVKHYINSLQNKDGQ
jgi:glycosyltransferase involved in cell wall biosynthesis